MDIENWVMTATVTVGGVLLAWWLSRRDSQAGQGSTFEAVGLLTEAVGETRLDATRMPVVRGGAAFDIDGELVIPQRVASVASLVEAGAADEDPGIVVSAGGRILAWLSGPSLGVAEVLEDRTIEPWVTSPLFDLPPEAHLLAVGEFKVGLKAVITGSDSTVVVSVDPDGTTCVLDRLAYPATAAAVVRTEQWVLADGVLALPNSVEWQPPSDVIDFDVAGEIGEETVAVLHGPESGPVLTLVRTPFDAPEECDGGDAIASEATGVVLVRNPFGSGRAIVAHLDNGNIDELPTATDGNLWQRSGGPSGA